MIFNLKAKYFTRSYTKLHNRGGSRWVEKFSEKIINKALWRYFNWMLCSVLSSFHSATLLDPPLKQFCSSAAVYANAADLTGVIFSFSFMSMMNLSQYNHGYFLLFCQFHIQYRCNYSQTRFKLNEKKIIQL